ncbi:hypothetical protein [Streptomyces sp. NPDC059460]
MDIRAIDPRDTAWQQEHDRYRVCFRDRPAIIRLAGVQGDPFGDA